jgi:DNA-directed RNA polymerase II subunit RPB3
MAEVPTMAIEIVNVEDNHSVLFDEFIAHRMGLLPLSSHDVGDIPPDLDFGFREHKDCNCFDGCPYCAVEFRLNVTNNEDRVLNVTHFDMEETNTYVRETLLPNQRVRICPFRDNSKEDFDAETRENGILICKLKKDQSLRMIAQARKGIPKYHSKFMPVATCTMTYQPIVTLDSEMVNELSLDDKIDFVQACPTKVFALDGEKVMIDEQDRCMYCDECVAKAKEWGKKNMITIKHDCNIFYFTLEAVTVDGPRSVIDVARAAFRVLDYKLSLFLQDTWGDEINEWLPYEPKVR